MFATGSIIKTRKCDHIADGITKVHKLYLQRGFKITCMHTDCEFESLRKEMTALGTNLNCAFKKEYVPKIDWLNEFTPLTPGAGLPDTKFPGQLILGNIPPPARRICPGASRG